MKDARAAFRMPLEVRFRDCDAMGHVNNAVYFTYFEQCRLLFWRALTGEVAPNVRVIVARTECDYRAPAYFGDPLEITCDVADIGRSSFVLAQSVEHAGSGTRLAEGRTVLVTYDYKAGRSIPIAGDLRQLLESQRRPA
ncbi:MAG: acyl-CoA thioesterase [Vicinamibacterales bacterium]